MAKLHSMWETMGKNKNYILKRFFNSEIEKRFKFKLGKRLDSCKELAEW